MTDAPTRNARSLPVSDMLTADLKNELLRHFDEAAEMGLSEADWAKRESSAMFQSHHYSGGFDATERAFLFSYFPDEGGEFWFDVDLADIERATATREVPDPVLRAAER